MRLGHLGDDNVVVALLDDRGHLAFQRAGRLGKDRRAVARLVVGLAADLAFTDIGGPEKGERQPLLILAKHVEHEFTRSFQHLVGA